MTFNFHSSVNIIQLAVLNWDWRIKYRVVKSVSTLYSYTNELLNSLKSAHYKFCYIIDEKIRNVLVGAIKYGIPTEKQDKCAVM